MNRYIRTGASLFALTLLLASALPAAGTEGWRKKFFSGGNVVAVNPLNPATVVTDEAPDSTVPMAISFDRGVTWQVHRSTGLTSIVQLFIHPNDTSTIFCAGGGLIRKSTDLGVTWKTIITGNSPDGQLLAMDPSHPDTMFAVRDTDGVIYKSFDRGEHWFTQGLAVNRVSAMVVRPDNPNILYTGVGLGSIAKSTDGGVTWSIPKHPIAGATVDVREFGICRSSPLVAYATFDGNVDTAVGVWKTTDGGSHWTKTAAPQMSYMGLDVLPDDPNTAFAGTKSALTTSVEKTTDGGATWTSLKTGLSAGGTISAIASCLSDPSGRWAAVLGERRGGAGAYRYGVTTTAVEGGVLNAATGDTVRNGYVVSAATGDSVDLAASRGRYAMYFFDGDPSLTPLLMLRAYPYYDTTLAISFLTDTLSDRPIAMRELNRCSVSGLIRDSLTQSPQRGLVTIHNLTSLGVMTFSDSVLPSGTFSIESLYVSYPPVNSYDWIEVSPDIPYAQLRIAPVVLPDAGYQQTFDLVPADVLVLAAADSSQYLPYYTDALDSLGITRNSWDALRRGPIPAWAGPMTRKRSVIYYTGSRHTALPDADKDSLTAMLDRGVRLFITGQDIAEKNDSSVLCQLYLQSGFQANTSITYISVLSGSIYSPLGFSTVNFGAGNQTSRDILTSRGIHAKPAMGYGFGNLGTAAMVVDSIASGTRAVFFGFGFEAISGGDIRQSIMRQTIGYLDGSIVLGVGEGPRGLPEEFSLSQNFPNPFNPATAVSFSVPVQSRVVVRVVDLLGRVVATLVDGERAAGTYDAGWDATPYSAGVYFLTMTALPLHSPSRPYHEVRKMLLLK